jgi:hypothetical protein
MAEVKVNIFAEDRATPVVTSVIETIRRSLGTLKEHLVSLDPCLEKSLRLDVSDALEAVDTVKEALASIPDVTTKTVIVEYKTKASPVMPFTEGIAHVKGLMDSLPDGQDYLVNFQGLSEDAFGSLVAGAYDARMNAVSARYRRGIGYNPMNYINARERAREAERFLMRLGSPTGHHPSLDFMDNRGSSGGGGGGARDVTIRVEGGIQVHGVKNAEEAAAGIDHELALRWRNRRSELRLAIEGTFGG